MCLWEKKEDDAKLHNLRTLLVAVRNCLELFGDPATLSHSQHHFDFLSLVIVCNCWRISSRSKWVILSLILLLMPQARLEYRVLHMECLWRRDPTRRRWGIFFRDVSPLVHIWIFISLLRCPIYEEDQRCRSQFPALRPIGWWSYQRTTRDSTASGTSKATWQMLQVSYLCCNLLILLL